MMTAKELEEYFYEHSFLNYERNNYDKYLFDKGINFSFKSIHITGTNGKGSTANYLSNIYIENGYKVGLYTSPYFDDVTEMVTINGENVSFEDYFSIFEKYKDDFEKYCLSSFEMQTIIAFLLFEQKSVDLAIVEVGMGGYIDATNIIEPILSIITSVSLEHTQYLGRSISEIASNKAGIIKYLVPTLVGKLDDSAMLAIREKAKEEKSQIYIVDDYHNEIINSQSIIFDYRPYAKLEISTSAKYQLKNVSIAIEATKILNSVFPINENALRKAIKANTLKGRFEYIKPQLVIDGGHNPEAIENLVNTLESCEKPIHIVFACFKDKNVDLMLNILGRISSDITLTTFSHKRARKMDDYFLYLEDYKFDENYIDTINQLINKYPDDLILVTGSLCFVGIVRGEFAK